MAERITYPGLRGAFFVVWAAYLAWVAFEGSHRWFVRWPMIAFAVVALGIALHFFRVAARQKQAR